MASEHWQSCNPNPNWPGHPEEVSLAQGRAGNERYDHAIELGSGDMSTDTWTLAGHPDEDPSAPSPILPAAAPGRDAFRLVQVPKPGLT